MQLVTKPILIQGAMENEIKYLINSIANVEKIDIYGYSFYKGIYKNYPIIISQTKIGMTEASIATFIAIKKFSPIIIINQGTAGACTENIFNGNIIIGNKSISINSYKTMDVEDNQILYELINFKEGKDELVTRNGNEKLINIAKKIKNDVIIGTIGSGDVWDKSINKLKWLNKEYEVICQDMETYAVYNICDKFNIPKIGIRVISNNEILHNEFDENVAIKSQEFALQFSSELIKIIGCEK